MPRDSASFGISAKDNTQKAFESVNNRFTRLKERAESVRGGINAMGKAFTIAGGAAVGALSLIYKENTKVVDSLAKQADVIGIGTKELQAYQHAAKLVGVSQNTVTESLIKSSKRLGEFTNGGGAAATWLKRLNLNVDELKKLNPSELFDVYSKSIQGLSTRHEKLAAMSALFGDESRKLIPLIQDGGAAIQQARKEFEDYGTALTRVDAAKVEAANDAMTRVSAVLKGFGQRFTVEIAPFIEAATKEIMKFIKESGGVGNIITNLFNRIVKGAGYAGDFIQGLRFAFVAVKYAVASVAVGVAELVDEIIFGFQKAQEKVLEFGRRALLPILDGLGYVSDSAFQARNNLVRAMRDAEKAAKSTSLVTQALQSTLDDVKKEMAEIAIQGLPSDKIEAALNRIKSKADEAAKKVAQVVKTRQESETGAIPLIAKKDDKEKKHEESLLKKVEALTTSLLTEEEKEQESYIRRLAMLEDAQERELITKERYNELERGLKEQHYEKLKELEETNTDEALAIWESGWKGKAEIVGGVMGQMATLMQSRSKTMFEIGKKAAIAETIVSTITSAQKAFQTFSAFPPVAAAVAASVAAAGLARVQQIRSTSFGGGGSASSSGGTTVASAGGISAESVPAAQATEPDGMTASNVTTIVVQGNPTREHLKELSGQMNQAARDGTNDFVWVFED